MMQEDSIKSPCVDICALDERDICIGCYRTADEITFWTQMNNEEKNSVLALCEERYDSKCD